MEKTIQLGPEGSVTFKKDGDNIVIDVTHAHASGKAAIHIEENMEYFFSRFDDKVNLPFGLDKIILMAIRAYVATL